MRNFVKAFRELVSGSFTFRFYPLVHYRKHNADIVHRRRYRANARLLIKADSGAYDFFAVAQDGSQIKLGSASPKYLSSEVSSGFTGVIIGLYAAGENTAEFNGFKMEY